MGTLLNANTEFFNKCIEAFSNTKYYVVISTGFDIEKNQLSDIPDNFLVTDSVPQQKLLEQVDIFITHAGMNSVNEAICSGVPMILLPHTYEQKLIADRVTELGLGIAGNINKITSENIYNFTDKIIEDSDFKKQAAKYKTIFSKEEKESHLKAADEIFNHINNQLQ